MTEQQTIAEQQTIMEQTITDDRRFAIKADAFYVRHDDGVWLRNNLGSFMIRGGGSYQLIAALFARLDGRRSMAQICADLPGPAAPLKETPAR